MKGIIAGVFMGCSTLFCSAQTIKRADGSDLATRYCYENTNVPLAGFPAGGTFSGCGVSIVAGQWVFNPVSATAGITVFPYQCTLSYTHNQLTRNIALLIDKPVVISPALEDMTTCDGSFVVEAQTLYAGAYLYQWSPASFVSRPDTSYTKGYIDQTQTLVLTAEDITSGCTGSDSLTIIRHARPVVTVKFPEVTLQSREQVILEASGAVTYQWSPATWLDRDTIARPTAFPQAPVTYTVTGTNEYGCSDTASVRIDILENIFVPNAFSPNGDGLNDVFGIANFGYQEVLSFQIFNRWGEVIYQTSDGTKGWDGQYKGQPADAGSYFYYIRVKFNDSSEKTFKGSVLLMR